MGKHMGQIEAEAEMLLQTYIMANVDAEEVIAMLERQYYDMVSSMHAGYNARHHS